MTKLLLACCIPLASLLGASLIAPQWFQDAVVRPAYNLAGTVAARPSAPQPQVTVAPGRVDANRTAEPTQSGDSTTARQLWQACQGQEPNPAHRRRACLRFAEQLQSTRLQCVQSARSGQAPGLRAHNPCERYAELLKLSGPAATVPRTASQTTSIPRRNPAPSPQPAARRSPSVYVNQCTTHRYGSIRYRECRAKEKQRLVDQCRRTRDEADWAVGERRQSLRDLARAQCHEAERYQIIR
ncbi:MAG: hypothetical protein ABF271_04495 [Abyssibacter sp.]|uniref:hypothetical protein n=1 Tax=Abyssibacter sp. TaxID=2320200 RepID=UPI00321A280A